MMSTMVYGQSSQTYTIPGTYTWTVPPCVTQITVQVWGGGGGGGSVWTRFDPTSNSPTSNEACVTAGGGGGGGFAQRTYTVVPGQVYTVVVGAGGLGGPLNTSGNNRANAGLPGVNSTFSGPATAGPGTLTGFGGGGGGAANFLRSCLGGCSGAVHQGANGAGGTGVGGANGTLTYTGGNGSAGVHAGNTQDRSGSGGGGAGSTGNGANANSTNGGVGGSGGGGNGGNGIIQPFGNGFLGTNGNPGNTISGGGGGATGHNRSSNFNTHYTRTGGEGARGEVRILYTTPSLPEPIFTAVLPICAGGNLSPLTTTSNNGFSGTWSPTLNNAATTTYVFTPNPSGPCADTASMTIVVNPAATPTFNPVTPICSGTSLSPLPTTSTNGIIGAWSPVLNNTATTNYTFTPSSGQCATTANLTITVNQLPVINNQPQNTGICANGSATLTVNATSGPYQWQYFDGTSWVNVTSSTPTGFTYSNSTGATLSIASTSAVCAAPAQYRVIAGSAGCSVISQVATVTVIRATRIAPTGPQCSGTALNFEACPTAANYTWSVVPPAGTSATPLSGSGQTFSFVPTNETGGTLPFTVNASVTYLGVTCPQTFTPNIVSPPDAGIDGNLIICNGSTPTNAQLFAALNGSPDAGGTWSNSNNVYTYTVAATAPCLPATANVTVTSNQVTPVFNSVGPICVGEILNPLPTNSINGVSGSWSPALDNQATTVYTFTPDPGECALNTTLTIQVNSATAVPLFDPISPICSGEFLAPLSIISINGITGGWSPSMNNAATTTYTFTPSSGQCATTASMIITVNQPTLPTFTPVGQICSGAPISPLPTASNNNINGSWSPALNNTATTTYTFAPSAGQCASSTTMTITVESPVTSTFNALQPICEGTSVNPLPLTSIEGISGSWSPVFTNAATTTYTFTPNSGQCASNGTLSVVVNPSVTPQFQQVAPICSGETLSPLSTISDNGIVGAWSPALNNTATTTYTFTPVSGQCAAPVDMTITVNSPSAVPTFPAIGTLCLGSQPPVLNSVSTNGISGTWSSQISTAVSGIQTYTFTPDPGVCGVSITLNITVADPVVPVFNPLQDICQNALAPALGNTSNNGILGVWSSQINSTVTGIQTINFTPDNGQCALPTSLSLMVNTLPAVNAGNDAILCAGDQITINATGANIFIWSNALSNGLIVAPAVGTNTYSVTGTDLNGCSSFDQLTIIVNPLPIVNAGSDQTICQGTSITLTGSGAFSYTWDNGVANGQQFTPSSGNLIYTVEGMDQNGCIGTDQVNINVIPTQVPTFQVIGSGCVPLTIALQNSTPNATNCEWMISNGDVLSGCNTVTTELLQGGCYDVTLTTEVNGCTASFTAVDIVCVEDAPVADFSFNPGTLSTLDPAVQFQNLSSGATNYLWNFGDNSAVNNETDPTHVFPGDASSNYEIMLVAYSQSGCTDTAYAYITVEEELIFWVPNTFTPDGDVYNQTFEPVFTSGFDPYNYHLTIFNRWGEIVFESYDHEIGWDGNYGVVNGGDIFKCQDGTYTWKIEYKMMNNDARQVAIGHVNILR